MPLGASFHFLGRCFYSIESISFKMSILGGKSWNIQGAATFSTYMFHYFFNCLQNFNKQNKTLNYSRVSCVTVTKLPSAMNCYWPGYATQPAQSVIAGPSLRLAMDCAYRHEQTQVGKEKVLCNLYLIVC